MKSQAEHPNPHPQRLAVSGVFVLFIALLLGCGAAQTTGQQVQNTPEVQDQTKGRAVDSQQFSPSTSDPAADLDAFLRKGMAYGDFRNLVLGKGWEPVVNPECKANFVGNGADDLCAKNPQLTTCRICARKRTSICGVVCPLIPRLTRPPSKN